MKLERYDDVADKYKLDKFGMINKNNICYINALFQGLLSCPTLNKEIVRLSKSSDTISLLIEWGQIIEGKVGKWTGVRISEELNKIDKKIKTQQQDVSEIFFFIMNILNPEVDYKKYKRKKLDTLLRHRYEKK